jgi:hypothetical protein
MRGSRIAKQIITEQRREAKRKQIVLQLREAMLRRRGKSNHDNSNTIDNINNN